MSQPKKQRFKGISYSFFSSLLSGFIVLILLFLSFSLLTVYFMKNKYHERIISYNEMNLDRTVDQYEYTFTASRNVLLSLYSNRSFSFLNTELQTKPDTDINQLNVHSIYQELSQSIRNNPHLMLEDIYLVMSNDLVINKDGISSATLLFTKYVNTPDYLEDKFWMKPFESAEQQIFPATLNSKETFGIVVKNPFVDNFYMVAFINQEEMNERFGHVVNSSFWMYDSNHQQIGGTTHTELPRLILQQQGHLLFDDNYYFIQQGEFSNLLYIDQVSKEWINQEVSQLYWLIIPVLLAAIAVSLFFSIFYSFRISNPVKHILHSLQSFQVKKQAPSSIKEFRSINQHVLDLNHKTQESSHELKQSNSLLKHFAFVNKLKAIDSTIPSSFKTEFSDQPFVFMVVDVYFKKEDDLSFIQDESRAVSYLCEYIRHCLNQSTLETLTFQTEKYQISSILFMDGTVRESQFQNMIKGILGPLVETLSWDEDTCIFSIGLSDLHSNSSELTTAYEVACERVNQRELNEQIQVILTSPIQEDVFLSSGKEQELQGYLSAANQNDCEMWIENILKIYKSKQARLNHVRQLLRIVINKIIQMHYSLDFDKSESDIALQQIQDCYTYEDCQILLNSVTHHITSQIKAKKDEKDELIQYVTQFLENNYHEDISLEMVADRMRITTSYLSTYFKGKTGVNFKDYLTNLRMTKAKQLLQETDLKIQDIALRVGYQNRNPFIRMFRKHTGLSPRDYRKQFLE